MEYLNRADLQFREQRRQLLLESSGERFGIDHLTAYWRPEEDDGTWRLEVSFLRPEAQRATLETQVPAVPTDLSAHNIRIRLEGRNDPRIKVLDVFAAPEEGSENVLCVRVKAPEPPSGDRAEEDLPVHTLEIVNEPTVDRFFSKADFVFKDGGTDLGSALRSPSREELPESPEIDYLARDYTSFRQLMLERMARFVPSWRERSPADIGVSIVELLAYSADYLSYYQDAVATEAYLSTARQRVSVRRHTRLLDYRLHEGTNARAWVQIQVADDAGEDEGLSPLAKANVRLQKGLPRGFELPAGIEVMSYGGRIPVCIRKGSKEDLRARERGVVIFETMHPVTLFPTHNEMQLYTWGARDYMLPAGTTKAALEGHFPDLRAGDVLLIERHEVAGRKGGAASEEVDPRERQMVRLRDRPIATYDPPLERGERDTEHRHQPITEIEWFPEDALTVEYPVSQTVDGVVYDRLTGVRGNYVMVDHGEVYRELLGPVPEEGPFAPKLSQRGLTHRTPYSEASRRQPAAGALKQEFFWLALPAIELWETRRTERDADMEEELQQGEDSGWTRLPWRRWEPHLDLLESGPTSQCFVAEMNERGDAYLRFGDGRAGKRPAPGSVFEAVYRVGRGPAGNVGGYALRHVVLPFEVLASCHRDFFRLVEAKNHLPGDGGMAKEPRREGALFGREAVGSKHFRRRCVVPEDYARVALRHPEVRSAVARRSYTGSWPVAELFVQRKGGRRLDRTFAATLREHMEPYLMTGWDLKLLAPIYVPLDIRLTVWPEVSQDAESFREKVEAVFADGKIDFLSPEHFSFGQTVYLSEVVSNTMAIPEVGAVTVDTFHRWGREPRSELEDGEIHLGEYEIAQLVNNPAAPHRGILRVKVAS